MAREVYDPTADRKAAKKGVKVFIASPKEGEEKKTVTFDAKAGPKGTATVKKETKKAEETKPKEAEKSKAAEPEKPKAEAKEKKSATAKPKAEKKPTFTDDQFMETLKAVGHPATSRGVSDKLGFDPDVGRGIVRARMERLIAEKKVVAVESGKKNIGKLYKLPWILFFLVRVNNQNI